MRLKNLRKSAWCNAGSLLLMGGMVAFIVRPIVAQVPGKAVSTNGKKTAQPAQASIPRIHGERSRRSPNSIPPAGYMAQFLEAPGFVLTNGSVTPPIAIASGDFNGDGKVDLVVVVGEAGAFPNGNLVDVLLGNGDGTLQPLKNYETAFLPIAVVVGDFNRDGKLDLAIAACGGTNNTFCFSSGVVSVLLGNGDGTFQAHVDYAVGGTSDLNPPNALAVGDFNGDGKLDILVADGNPAPGIAPTISVLQGNGDGTFQTHKDFTAGAAGYSLQSAAIGDFNGDGKVDLAIAQTDFTEGSPAYVNVLMGNGDATFQPFVSYQVANQPIHGVAVADLNGDGKGDLIVTCSDVGLRTLLGNANGTFQSPVAYGTTASDDSNAIVVADFNGNGKLDVAFTYDSGAALVLGNGDGTFGSELLLGTGNFPVGLTAADFNGDGKLDIATADNADSTVDILLAQGNGEFVARRDFSEPGLGPVIGSPRSAALADFNGDGKADLVVAIPCGVDPQCSSGAVGVRLGNGDGNFKPEISFVTGAYASSVAVGDLNNDGKPDIITANYQSISTVDGYGALVSLGLSVLLGNGDGTFRTHTDYLAKSTDTDNSGYLDMPSIAAIDINGDGNLDVIATGPGLGAFVWLGNGDGTLRPAVPYPAGSDSSALAVGDFNSDGRLDLAVTNGAEYTTYDRYGNPVGACRGMTVSVLLGNGDGVFAAPKSFATGSDPGSIAVGDFNGDGRLDIAIGSQPTSTCDSPTSILLGNGDGTFQGHVDIAQSSGWIVASDFNVDGNLDLLTEAITGDFYSSAVSLYLGNGDATFQSPTTYPVGSIPYPTVGDVNSDGEPDVITANSVSSTLSVLLNIEGPAFSVHTTPVKPVKAGQSASSTAQVTSFAGFNGTVSLSCSVSPAKAGAPTCLFTPNSVQLAARGSANSTLTINTTGSSAALARRARNGSGFLYAMSLLPIGGMALAGSGFISGKKKRISVLLMMVCGLIFLGACGGRGGGGGSGGGGASGTPSGTYTLTVTGMSGAIVSSTALSLVVQ